MRRIFEYNILAMKRARDQKDESKIIFTNKITFPAGQATLKLVIHSIIAQYCNKATTLHDLVICAPISNESSFKAFLE